MKYFSQILLGILLAQTALGAAITDSTLTLGKADSSTKTFIANKVGTAKPKLRYNQSTSKWEFSNDGTSWKAFGSGGGGGSGVVLNENFGFEDNLTNWTASGSSVAAVVSSLANVAFGSQAASWDASATAEFFSYAATAIPAGLYGKTCSLSWYYKAGDANLKMQVTDGTNVLAESSAFLTAYASIFSPKQVLYFTCPSSGNLVVRVASTGNAALVYLDDVKLGQESFFNAGSQGFVGKATWATATNCVWNTNTFNSFVTPAADADCATPTVTGGISAPTTKIPAVKLNVIAGETYYVVAQGMLSSGSGGANCAVRVTDGTDNGTYGSHGGTAQSVGLFSSVYTPSTSGSKTLALQFTGTDGTDSCDISANTNGRTLSISVFKYSSATSDAVTVDQQDWHLTGNIGGANINLGSSSLTTYTEITDASLDMVLAPGSAAAQIACSGTNPSTGLTCSAGLESLGFTASVPTAGRYTACFDVSHQPYPSGGTDLSAIFQLVETPGNAQTISQEGGRRVVSAAGLAASSYGPTLPVKVCGEFNFASAGPKTIRLMREQNISGGINSNLVLADRSGTQGQRDIAFSMSRGGELRDALKFTFPSAEIHLQKAVGEGSTNTMVRYYANVTSNTPNSCLSYNPSSTLGDSFTVLCDGTYSISMDDQRAGTNSICAITRNATGSQLTTASTSTCQSSAGTDPQVCLGWVNNDSGFTCSITRTKKLSAGDIIRCQSNGGNAANADGSRCSITRVGY